MSLIGKARVRITVEIGLTGRWGSDCTIAQIEKQAREEAIQSLRLGVAIRGLQAGLSEHRRDEATLVGVPQVDTVIVSEEP